MGKAVEGLGISFCHLSFYIEELQCGKEEIVISAAPVLSQCIGVVLGLTHVSKRMMLLYIPNCPPGGAAVFKKKESVFPPAESLLLHAF